TGAVDAHTTGDDGVVGTLPYMAPEQWIGAGVDAQSDLWAVGIMLWELCTGAHPLAPLTVPRLAKTAHLDTPMPRRGDRHPEVGPRARLLDACLEKQKSARIGSAAELVAALEAAVHDREAPAQARIDDPFAGLAAFQEADAGRFFGRDRDVTAM